MTSRLALCLWIAAFPLREARAETSKYLTTLSATVVDSNGKPVPDAVVYVSKGKSKKYPPPDAPAVMDQVDQEFQPHVLAVLAGTRVQFPNKDRIHHDLYSFSPAKTFELPLYKGKPAEPVLFDKPGVVKLGCNIHDWMAGTIFVLENPYFAKTDAQGHAEVTVPKSKAVQVAVFHELEKTAPETTAQTISTLGALPAAAWKLDLKPAKPVVKKKLSETDY